jgi:hypothetical protein
MRMKKAEPAIAAKRLLIHKLVEKSEEEPGF